MSESPKESLKKQRPPQRVDLGASSGPAPWLDDPALVKNLREQLATSQAEVAMLREALTRITSLPNRFAMEEALFHARGIAFAALATSGKDKDEIADA